MEGMGWQWKGREGKGRELKKWEAERGIGWDHTEGKR